jgi:Tol biopolymer transport system component
MQHALKGTTDGRGARTRRSPRLMLGLVVLALSAAGCGQGAGSPASDEIPRRNGDILFTKDDRLYLMRPDGTRQRLIPGSPRDVTDASWSPDGTRIAFARLLGGSCPARLYMMWPGGTHVRPFSPSVNDPVMESSCVGGTSWSPDGQRIAFTKDDLFGSSIWVRSVDRAPPRELSEVSPQSEGRDDRHPAWSPDGKTIVFDRGEPSGATPGLWLMDADGGNQHRLDTGSLPCAGAQDAGASEPAWSPDGEWIAFAGTCRRPVGRYKAMIWGDIYTIRPDGSDLRRLTDGRGRSAENSSPAWSPDGKRIVFDTRVSRSPAEKIDDFRLAKEEFDDIYVMSADGTGQKRLIRLLDYTIAPDWGAAIK